MADDKLKLDIFRTRLEKMLHIAELMRNSGAFDEESCNFLHMEIDDIRERYDTEIKDILDSMIWGDYMAQFIQDIIDRLFDDDLLNVQHYGKQELNDMITRILQNIFKEYVVIQGTVIE